MMRAPNMPRPTYANVMSSIALFVALGGASYAASSVAPGSVGTKQLRNGAVVRGSSHSIMSRVGTQPFRWPRDLSRAELSPGRGEVPAAGYAANHQTSLRLTRPGRLIVAANNVVTNNARSGANVFLLATLQNANVTRSGCSVR